MGDSGHAGRERRDVAGVSEAVLEKSGLRRPEDQLYPQPGEHIDLPDREADDGGYRTSSGTGRDDRVEHDRADEQAEIRQIQEHRRRRVPADEPQRRSDGPEHAPSILDDGSHFRVVEHDIAGGEQHAEYDVERRPDRERGPLLVTSCVRRVHTVVKSQVWTVPNSNQ